MPVLYALIALGSLATWYLLDRYCELFDALGGGLNAVVPASDMLLPSLMQEPLHVAQGGPMTTAGVATLLLAVVVVAALQTSSDSSQAAKYRGREYGSAHWLDPKRLKAYRARKFEDNYALSQHFLLRRDKIKLARFRGIKRDPNRHVKVLGGSGSWKSSAVLDPNLLMLGPRTNASAIIGDPKGKAMLRHARHLIRDGYKVKVVDFLTFNSLGMNVFSILRSTADIPILASMIIDNTTPPEEHKDFWTRAEHGLYLTCIGWLYFFGDEETRNLPGLIDIVQLADASEEDESAVSALDVLIEDVAANYSPEDDEYYIVRCYDFFKKSAGKTAKSILSSCGIRLAPFNVPEVRRLTMTDEIEIEKIGLERTVLFCNFSATDKTYSFLVAFLFNALFMQLERCATEHGGRLPVPVTMHCDEVAHYGRIKDLETMIAFLRGFGVNLWLYLQADSQLNDVYGEQRAKTITGNCDTTLFLGSVDYDTCEQFSKILGNETVVVETTSRTTGAQPGYTRSYNKVARPLMSADELGNDMLEGDECIVKIKQEAPFKDSKTNITKHPRIKDLDGDDGLSPEGELVDLDGYLETYRASLRARRIRSSFEARGLAMPKGDTSFEGMYEGVGQAIYVGK